MFGKASTYIGKLLRNPLSYIWAHDKLLCTIKQNNYTVECINMFSIFSIFVEDKSVIYRTDLQKLMHLMGSLLKNENPSSQYRNDLTNPLSIMR